MARIIVVDDQPSALKMVERILAPRGHECRCFVTGSDALRVAVAFQPDLLITDVRMPDMDGVTLVRKLRASLKEKCPPILFMSGYGDVAAELPTSLRASFISKPFSSAGLNAAVGALIGPGGGS